MRRIAIIGIGYIGKIFVEDLTDEGYEVVGHDVDESKRGFVREHGGEWGATPAEAAADADAVVLAVPGAPEVRSVFEHEGGLLEVLDTGDLVIDTSTTGPDAAEALSGMCAERDVAFLTAPLTRSAPAGGVHMMVGGTEDDYEVGMPLLDEICRRHMRIGSAADAQSFKIILQVRYACQEAVDAEIVAFARDVGLDPHPYREFLELDISEKYLERDFSPVIEGLGGLAIWHKDIGYALDLAREEHTATPVTNAVFEAYKYGMHASGEDEGSDTAILRYWENLNAN